MTYSDINMTTQTKGTVDIKSGSNDSNLSLDTDGDGNVDQQIQPDDVAYSVIKVFLPFAVQSYSADGSIGWGYDVRVDDTLSDNHKLFPNRLGFLKT